MLAGCSQDYKLPLENMAIHRHKLSCSGHSKVHVHTFIAAVMCMSHKPIKMGCFEPKLC